MVRDHRPLQQGLRQTHLDCAISFVGVRDHCPLQQGLRPPGDSQFLRRILWRTRPLSTTTRIKTPNMHHTQYQELSTIPSSTTIRINTAHLATAFLPALTASARPSSTTIRIKTP